MDIATALTGWRLDDGFAQELKSMLTRIGARWEPWSPRDWRALQDVLEGWQIVDGWATETDGRYRGPEGIAFAGDAAEHMLVLLVDPDSRGRLCPAVVEWNQTEGRFETLAASPVEFPG